jgi:hypothetical protein
MKKFLCLLILLSLCFPLQALDDDDIEFYLKFVIMRNLLLAGTSVPPLAVVIISDETWAIVDGENPIIIYNRRRYLLVPQGKGYGYGVPLQGNPRSKEEALIDPNATTIRYEVRDI